MFVVYNLLSQKDATKTFKGLKQWFENNPKRKVCNTDLGKVRRSQMKEDFLKFCKPSVKLKD